MKIVLEAGIITAALAARGLCSDGLYVCCAYHEIYIPENEKQAVYLYCRSKLRLPAQLVQDVAEWIENISYPCPAVFAGKRKTYPLRAAAAAMGADVIVTMNKKCIFRRSGLPRILTPRLFWVFLGGQEKEE